MAILDKSYKMGWILTLAYLATYRPKLEKENLLDAYQGENYPKPQFACEGARLSYRTLDGTCNDLNNPMAGSINMFFGRNMPGKVVDDSTILDPHPRVVSQTLLKRENGKAIEATGLNLLVTSWIQFQTHDWVFHDMKGAPMRVPVPKDDPMYATAQEMLIPRSVSGRAQVTGGGNKKAAAYPNQSTAWWDLSQIYGTNAEANKKMRSGVDGKLKFNEQTGWLPFMENGQELAAFSENWWTGLAMWHNLWTREHNHVCDLIKKAHPNKSDQELHDLARLAVTNVNAKVHTIEWTEAVLNNKALHVGMHANWYGIGGSPFYQSIARHIPLLKRSSVFAGLTRGKQHNDGVAFSLTEEFASVYRMHSLIPDKIDFRTLDNPKDFKEVNIKETAFGKTQQILNQYKPRDLFYTFGRQSPTALVLKNFPEFLMNLVKPTGHEANVLIDVAVRDIIRERERGVPRYNEFRRQMKLKPIKTFDDLVTKDKAMAAQISKVYGGDVEKIDLLIGCLAEDDRPENFGFGETAFSIFIVMASRRLKTDRFLNEYFTPEVYTPEGFDYAVTTGMKDIIARQYPELKPKFQNLKNVFFEWSK